MLRDHDCALSAQCTPGVHTRVAPLFLLVEGRNGGQPTERNRQQSFQQRDRSRGSESSEKEGRGDRPLPSNSALRQKKGIALACGLSRAVCSPSAWPTRLPISQQSARRQRCARQHVWGTDALPSPAHSHVHQSEQWQCRRRARAQRRHQHRHRLFCPLTRRATRSCAYATPLPT